MENRIYHHQLPRSEHRTMLHDKVYARVGCTVSRNPPCIRGGGSLLRLIPTMLTSCQHRSSPSLDIHTTRNQPTDNQQPSDSERCQTVFRVGRVKVHARRHNSLWFVIIQANDITLHQHFLPPLFIIILSANECGLHPFLEGSMGCEYTLCPIVSVILGTFINNSSLLRAFRHLIDFDPFDCPIKVFLSISFVLRFVCGNNIVAVLGLKLHRFVLAINHIPHKQPSKCEHTDEQSFPHADHFEDLRHQDLHSNRCHCQPDQCDQVARLHRHIHVRKHLDLLVLERLKYCRLAPSKTNRQGGSRNFFLFVFSCFVYLSPVNGHILWCIDSEFHDTIPEFRNLDYDVVINHNSFFDSAGENEHSEMNLLVL
jgi:hypothetical protein